MIKKENRPTDELSGDSVLLNAFRVFKVFKEVVIWL